jgi:hypothetical protein
MTAGGKVQLSYFSEPVIGLSKSVTNFIQTIIPRTYVADEHPMQQTLIRIYAQQRYCCNSNCLQEYLYQLYPVSNSSINKGLT